MLQPWHGLRYPCMRQRGYMSGPLQPPGPCQTLIAVQHFNDEIHRMSCALRLQPHGCQGPWQASISQCCKPAPARLPRSFPSTVMQAGTAELVYCDTPQTLFEAAAAIRQAGSAVVDCEGHELGDAQGRLTIIQVVPVSPQPVSYVVDVMKLQMQGAPALQPLLQLLADPTITKVMFDCRNDATALWHELDCKLQVRELRDGCTSCLFENTQCATLQLVYICSDVMLGSLTRLFANYSTKSCWA